LQVTIPALNDSQLIGVCIYNVFVLSAMGVIVSAVLSSKVTLSFCVMSAISLIATNTTACIIFVPKVSSTITQLKPSYLLPYLCKWVFNSSSK
jgi:gamma-aminobutyric acid type B receptor